MSNNVIYKDGPNRMYKKCFCCVCETVQVCTPGNDFYTTEDHEDDLVCEQCFRIYVIKIMEGKK